MAYHSLTANEGYFLRRDSLEADLKTEAEDAADDFIDLVFAQWDRSGWTGAGVPPSIDRGAKKFGSAYYLDQVHQGKDSKWPALLEAAKDEIREIAERGGPLLSDGTQQGPLSTAEGDTTGRSIAIVNG